jgi:inner membrane protein
VLAPDDAADFRIDLELRGSEALQFAAAGRQTRASLQSGWPHPAFRGAWLPRERDVGAQGFSASWEVPAVARGLPPAWKLGAIGDEAMAQARFGVDFLYPVDPYRMSERSLKYCALFIGLAFLVIWLVETLTRRPVHPVHALLLGAALCLFYLLELSLAEQFGFTVAYGLASAAVTLQVSLYARAALSGTRPALALASVVASLYGLLFLLLREEDYALLIGASSLFAVLSVVMFLTRRIGSLEPMADQ